tara:strand:+ start:313 stop:1047 length:735 start_codon:yes stop_codon:yes gene_type:complete
LSVNDGATDKLPEADKLLNAVSSVTELALTDAVLARVDLPNLVINAPAVKVAELLNEETPVLVTIPEEETEQLPDIEDTQEPSKKASEETEAELLAEETPPISTKPVEGAEPVLVIKLAAPSSRIPTSVVEAEAERLADTCISCTAEPETEPVVLRTEEPRCVSALTSGIVERGNSLIAPKPSITLPYLQRLTNPINLLYNIYTLIFNYQSANIINAAPVVSASATNSCAPYPKCHHLNLCLFH